MAYRNQAQQGFQDAIGRPEGILNSLTGSMSSIYDRGAEHLNKGMDQFYASQRQPDQYGDVFGGLRDLTGQAGQMGQMAGNIKAPDMMSLWDRMREGTKFRVFG